jgi:hypothetical protein
MLFLLILILPFFVSQVESGTSTNTLYVHAEGATIWTDKGDYGPEETVTIFGSGFLANKQVAITIRAPDSSVATIYATTDGSGAFTAYYTLDGMEGTYTVAATDGTNTATTTFTDTTYRYFTATISPNTAITGETKSYTITITNDMSSSSGVVLGSAKIVVPPGFTIISSLNVSYPSGKPWTATLVSGYIKLNTTADSYRLSRGQSVSVTFSATAPETAGTYTWTTSAWVDRSYGSGTAFTLKPGTTQPKVTVSTPPTVSITITSSPVIGSGFVKVDGTAYDTPHTFTWTVGGTHTLQALSPVSGGTGTQYVYTSWSAPSFGSSTSQTYTYTVPSSAETVTANYKTQWQVTFQQSGLSSDATGTVLTVGTNTYTYSQLPLTNIWVDDGTTYSYTGTVSAGTGKQYVLTGVTGLTSPIHSSGTVTANYKTQYQHTITSSPATGSGYVTVDGSAVTTPYTTPWWDSGSSHTIAANSPVTIVSGQSQYIYSSWSDSGAQSHSVSPTTVTTYTANFQLQYYLSVTGGNSPKGAGWYNSGVSATASSTWVWNTVAGQSRTALTNWQLDTVNQNPSRSNTGNLTTSSITMSAYHVVNFVSTTQYYLTVTGGNSISYGTASPTSDNWYDSGQSTTVSSNWVWDIVSGQSRYALTNWQLDGVNQNPTRQYSGTLTTSSITMSTYHTVNFLSTTRYYFSVSSAYDSPTGQAWYDTGSSISSTVTRPVSGGTGIQYETTGWTGTGSLSSGGTAGSSSTSSFTINAYSTCTWNWKTQYQLTMGTNFGTTSPSVGDHWYDAGSVVSISATAPSVVDGERYVWNGWTGTGTISYTGMNNPATVTMNSPITQTASWTHQYRLTMATNFGATSPSVGEHWYDAGSVVSIGATPPSVVDGERYVWLGWTGTGTISYSGMDNPASVTMNSPITETAAWRHEYRLTMATNFGTTSPSVGTHWYEVGTPVPIQAFAPSVITGEQYVWNGWTGTGTVSYTGTANPSSVTMNSPISETASWTHQFLLTIKTSGLPSAYPTKVYLAGSQVGTASDASPYTKWFDAETPTGTIGVDNTISGAADTRYVFVEWVEDSSTNNPRASENMNSPKSFTTEYKTQYQVSFTQTGSGVAPTVTYTADTDPIGTVPFSVWVKAGSEITYAYQDTVLGAPGVRYVLIGVTLSSPQTVNSPLTISGSYKTQYQITVTASPSEALGGTFKVTYTQCGTTYTNVQKTTSWTEWVDGTTAVTVSEPQDIVNGYKFDHYDPSAGVTMDGAKTITLVYTSIGSLSVTISPTTAKIKVGESVTFTSTVSGGVPGYSYKWYLNGTEVSGAISPTWTFTPVTSGTYNVYLNVTDSIHNTAKSNIASVTVAPPLIVSISPTSASILVGQSVTFTSTPSGGYPPYSYQWYLGGVQVSGATSASWTFTPTTSGIYYVYLQVKDANNNIAQSETAKITVIPSVPVGGYSISLAKRTPTSQIAAYTLLIALFGVALSLRKRKRK